MNVLTSLNRFFTDSQVIIASLSSVFYNNPMGDVRDFGQHRSMETTYGQNTIKQLFNASEPRSLCLLQVLHVKSGHKKLTIWRNDRCLWPSQRADSARETICSLNPFPQILHQLQTEKTQKCCIKTINNFRAILKNTRRVKKN